ncbi:unnamed protein product [Echinostoma caproni]|uniref:Uncharacterized protein n=1 Tax=Echinostoma caproni TaxID=27848 RepID=A0A183A0W2_9TREM|nr:unnamed protein product [Echinostoma caproni]
MYAGFRRQASPTNTTYGHSWGNSPRIEISKLQHQSPASAVQRTTSTPISGSPTPTLFPTGHRRNDEGSEPTLVGRMTVVTANRKDRPDDVVPTQLETSKELWATVARGASVNVIPSAVPQRLRTKSMPETKSEKGFGQFARVHTRL